MSWILMDGLVAALFLVQFVVVFSVCGPEHLCAAQMYVCAAQNTLLLRFSFLSQHTGEDSL